GWARIADRSPPHQIEGPQIRLDQYGMQHYLGRCFTHPHIGDDLRSLARQAEPRVASPGQIDQAHAFIASEMRHRETGRGAVIEAHVERCQTKLAAERDMVARDETKRLLAHRFVGIDIAGESTDIAHPRVPGLAEPSHPLRHGLTTPSLGVAEYKPLGD